MVLSRPLIIREATIDDAPEIAAVLLQSFEEYKALFDPVEFEKSTPSADAIAWRIEDRLIWVASLGAEIVGTISATDERDDLYVRGMAVLPKARGQNVGMALLDHAEEYARNRGCARIVLNTRLFMIPAIRVYERAKFLVTGEPPHGDCAGPDLITMVKVLDAPSSHAAEGRVPRAKLEFWFDFASTYSYIAAMRVEELCAREGVTLEWMPFLLGPIFALQGWDDSPFNLNTRRGTYMWRDVARLAAKYDLPWVKPRAFPRRSTIASRVACAVAHEPWCGDFVRSIFVANFGQDRDIGDPAVVASVLGRLGKTAGDLLTLAVDDDHRTLLRANTQRAMELGIFGAPNCLVNGELFWGEETLEDAIAWLKRGS